jgi:hypothetical protein
MEIKDLPKDKKIILLMEFVTYAITLSNLLLNMIKMIFSLCFSSIRIRKNILKHIGINNNQIDSIVLYQPGIAYLSKLMQHSRY